jgi:HAD superfamily hydrolase (TIGR01509 family)
MALDSVKHLLFDCDGVLVDSEYLASHLMADMLKPYGSTTTADDILKKYMGQKDYEIVRTLAKMHDMRLPEDIMDRYVHDLDKELAQRVEAIKGIDQVLANNSLPRAIVSNSHLSRITTSLKKTGLASFFDQTKIFTADIAKAAKPDPAIYRFSLNTLGWDPQQVVVIEDSPTGVSAAHGAGMRVIGFLAASHDVDSQREKLKANGAWKIVETSEQLDALLKEICI